MCYDKLADYWEASDEHIPGMKEAAKIMKRDSGLVEDVGDRLNLDFLSQEARRNQERPSEGIAKASVATGLGFLGAGAGGAFGGAGGASGGVGTNATGLAAENAAQQLALQEALNSAQYASQQGMLSSGGLMDGMAGLSGSMESALPNQGYMPSSLMNAFKYGPDSGQSMGTTMQNYGQGLMSRATSPGFRQAAGKKMLMRSGMSLMDQGNQPPPPPPPPPRYQPEQMMPMYMSEEEKRRLMMQRGIY